MLSIFVFILIIFRRTYFHTVFTWLHRVIIFGVVPASVMFWMFLYLFLHPACSNLFHVIAVIEKCFTTISVKIVGFSLELEMPKQVGFFVFYLAFLWFSWLSFSDIFRFLQDTNFQLEKSRVYKCSFFDLCKLCLLPLWKNWAFRFLWKISSVKYLLLVCQIFMEFQCRKHKKIHCQFFCAHVDITKYWKTLMSSFECAQITWALFAMHVWSQNYKEPPVRLFFAPAYI